MFQTTSNIRNLRTSSTTSSSGQSSRPVSTIETFINKMKAAEKMKEADRSMPSSPYPYMCYTPEMKSAKLKVKLVTDLTPNPLVSNLLVSNPPTACKSRECSSLGYELMVDQEPIFSELGQMCSSPPSRSSSLAIKCSSDVKLPAFPKLLLDSKKSETTVRSLDMSESTTICAIDDDDEDRTDKLSSGRNSFNSISDRQSKASRRTESVQSNDSISQEMCHFKPIHSCPLTPPKQLPSGKFHEAPLIRTTPRNLSKLSFGSPSCEKSLSDIDANSPLMKRRLSELEEERKFNVKRLSKFTNTNNDSENLESGCSVSTQVLPSGDQKDKDFNNFKEKMSKRNMKKVFFDDSSKPSKSIRYSSSVCLKKLVIPLEAHIDDGLDFDIPPPLTVNNNITNLDSDSSSSSMHHRKKIITPNQDKYKGRKEDLNLQGKAPFLSTQRSIEDWMVKGGNAITNPSTKLMKDSLYVTCFGRDEVDGEHLVRKKTKKIEKKQLPNGHKTLDRFVRKMNREVDDVFDSKSEKGGVTNMRRERRVKQDDSYIYPDLSPKKKKMKCVNEDSVLSDSEAGSFVCSEASSDSDSSCTEAPYNRGKQVKRSLSKVENERQNYKKRKVTHTKSKVTKSKALVVKELKTCRTSASRSKHNKTHKQPSKTSNQPDISSIYQEKKERSFPSMHLVDPLDIVDLDEEMEDYVDMLRQEQEESDQKLAVQLARQYQLEAKMSLQIDRFKGGKNEYEFRKRARETNSSIS